MINTITGACSIESISPYCQSRYHGEPSLQGENPDAYDLRTWRHRMHVKDGHVCIPAKAMHDALTDAAKYSKRQITGQGKATWTAKFASGIAILEDIDIGVDADATNYVPVYCHATGKPGTGSRVLRRFPIIPQWKAEFEVTILDPIITEEIFRDMLEQAGMFVGLGQNRPQNRGVHGRFRVLSVQFSGQPQPDERRMRLA